MARILLVEDNEMNRDLLSRRLQRHGHQVLLAEDGQAGIATIHRELPDLILMDMSLPVVDGREATRRLKGAAETKGIPIIALIAYAMTDDEQRAKETGCDDYATKPIELPRLFEKIQAQLDRRPAP